MGGTVKYYSLVGSYEGCVLMHKEWVRVQDLNKLDKTNWKRHQGLATRPMVKALAGTVANHADIKAACQHCGFINKPGFRHRRFFMMSEYPQAGGAVCGCCVGKVRKGAKAT